MAMSRTKQAGSVAEMDKKVNPFAFKPDQRIFSLGKVFDAPLALQGLNGFQ
jgi:hypothetical protein